MKDTKTHLKSIHESVKQIRENYIMETTSVE